MNTLSIEDEIDEFIALHVAAHKLGITPRSLATLAERHGYPIFRLGHRTRRLKLADFRAIIRATQEVRV